MVDNLIATMRTDIDAQRRANNTIMKFTLQDKLTTPLTGPEIIELQTAYSTLFGGNFAVFKEFVNQFLMGKIADQVSRPDAVADTHQKLNFFNKEITSFANFKSSPLCEIILECTLGISESHIPVGDASTREWLFESNISTYMLSKGYYLKETESGTTNTVLHYIHIVNRDSLYLANSASASVIEDAQSLHAQRSKAIYSGSSTPLTEDETRKLTAGSHWFYVVKSSSTSSVDLVAPVFPSAITATPKKPTTTASSASLLSVSEQQKQNSLVTPIITRVLNAKNSILTDSIIRSLTTDLAAIKLAAKNRGLPETVVDPSSKFDDSLRTLDKLRANSLSVLSDLIVVISELLRLQAEQKRGTSPSNAQCIGVIESLVSGLFKLQYQTLPSVNIAEHNIAPTLALLKKYQQFEKLMPRVMPLNKFGLQARNKELIDYLINLLETSPEITAVSSSAPKPTIITLTFDDDKPTDTLSIFLANTHSTFGADMSLFKASGAISFLTDWNTAHNNNIHNLDFILNNYDKMNGHSLEDLKKYQGIIEQRLTTIRSTTAIPIQPATLQASTDDLLRLKSVAVPADIPGFEAHYDLVLSHAYVVICDLIVKKTPAVVI